MLERNYFGENVHIYLCVYDVNMSHDMFLCCLFRDLPSQEDWGVISNTARSFQDDPTMKMILQEKKNRCYVNTAVYAVLESIGFINGSV